MRVICGDGPTFSVALILLRSTVVATLAVLAATFAAGASAARLALVIGNDVYQHVPKLRNAGADAQAMAAALREAGYDVTLQTDRTLRQLQSDFRAFRQRISGGDEVVVFFSGHGVQLSGGNYLLPVDVSSENEDQVKDETLLLNKVLDDVRERRPRFTLAIIDACRDNPFQGSGRNIGGRGLGAIAGATGQMVIYAAGEGQKALDRLSATDTVRNGLFTRVFVREMSRPGVSIRDVLFRVRDEVANLAESVRHEQVPAVYDQVRGNFFFFPPGNATQTASVLSGAVPPQTPPSTPPSSSQPSPQVAMLSPTPQLAQEALTVRIGHVAPTSGAIGHLGRDNEKGAILAVEELNARGLVIGGRPIRLELIQMDDAADPKQGVAAAERMVDAGVSAVVGHLNSGTSIPASAVYSRAGIPQISPSATNPLFTRQGRATAFRLVLDDARLGELLGRHAVRGTKARRIVVVDDRTAYGAGIADSFAAGAKAAGAQITNRLFTNDRATDFTEIVRAIARERPDLVFFGGLDAVAGPLLRQLQSAGLSMPMYGGDGICSSELPRLAGGRLTMGQVVCAEAGGVTEAMRAFEARFRARFRDAVQVYAPYTYDAVHLIVDAMKRAGSTTPTAVLRALPQTNLLGITGPIRFDGRGDIMDGAMTFYSFDGTRRETVGLARAGQ